MDPNTNKIIVSRNVKFHETFLPSKVLPSKSETHSFLFPNLEFFLESCYRNSHLTFDQNVPSTSSTK